MFKKFVGIIICWIFCIETGITATTYNHSDEKHLSLFCSLTEEKQVAILDNVFSSISTENQLTFMKGLCSHFDADVLAGALSIFLEGESDCYKKLLSVLCLNDTESSAVPSPYKELTSLALNTLLQKQSKSGIGLFCTLYPLLKPDDQKSEASKFLSSESSSTMFKKAITDVQRKVFMLCEGARCHLNDFSRSGQDWELNQAVGTLICCKKLTNDSPSYFVTLGILCYQYGDKLDVKQLEMLGLTIERQKIPEHGIFLLKQAAKNDSMAEEYLATHYTGDEDE
ncbi:MAG: hypothetical protein LBM19_01155 [Holosporales bacterium]|jgi:hypothetical protein|nr:hypothetical protein [Holosporales bacterium]